MLNIIIQTSLLLPDIIQVSLIRLILPNWATFQSSIMDLKVLNSSPDLI